MQSVGHGEMNVPDAVAANFFSNDAQMSRRGNEFASAIFSHDPTPAPSNAANLSVYDDDSGGGGYGLQRSVEVPEDEEDPSNLGSMAELERLEIEQAPCIPPPYVLRKGNVTKKRKNGHESQKGKIPTAPSSSTSHPPRPPALVLPAPDQRHSRASTTSSKTPMTRVTRTSKRTKRVASAAATSNENAVNGIVKVSTKKRPRNVTACGLKSVQVSNKKPRSCSIGAGLAEVSSSSVGANVSKALEFQSNVKKKQRQK
jgi:hypothetical protein